MVPAMEICLSFDPSPSLPEPFLEMGSLADEPLSCAVSGLFPRTDVTSLSLGLGVWENIRVNRWVILGFFGRGAAWPLPLIDRLAASSKVDVISPLLAFVEFIDEALNEGAGDVAGSEEADCGFICGKGSEEQALWRAWSAPSRAVSVVSEGVHKPEVSDESDVFGESSGKR